MMSGLGVECLKNIHFYFQNEYFCKKIKIRGTVNLDAAGLTNEEHKKLKRNIGNGAADWTDITPDGDVVVNDGDGNALNLGHYTDWLN